MFFSVLMMLFVAFAYAEGTPASTKLPVEKISVNKFSEASKNKQNFEKKDAEENSISSFEWCFFDISYTVIDENGQQIPVSYTVVGPCPGQGWITCIPEAGITVCIW